jgi:hypothetical protein
MITLVTLSLSKVIKTVAMLVNSASRSKPLVALKKLGQMVLKMSVALLFNTQDQKDAKNTVSSTCNTLRL